MSNQSQARTLAAETLRSLKRRGVDYADVRCEHLLHESLVAEQGRIASISLSESAGIGIRVLVKGSWSFAGTPHLTAAGVRRAGAQAIELAKAASLVSPAQRPPATGEPVKARRASRWTVDPFAVPRAQKIYHLLWANTTLLGPDAIKRAATHQGFYKRWAPFRS